MVFPLVVCVPIKRLTPSLRLLASRKKGNNMCQETLSSSVSSAPGRHGLVGHLFAALFLLLFWCAAIARTGPELPTIAFSDLPVEARHTVALIRQGGPFPFPKDGSVFGNYEGVLPKQKRGYYHEFTVRTPGSRNRGARRIVIGGDWQTSRELYYTADHYATFRRIKE